MAKIKEKPKEAPKDVFQSKGEEFAEKLGTKINQQGRNILIAIGGVAAVVILIGVWSWLGNRRNQQAFNALGKAYKVETAQVSASPQPDSTTLTFSSEKERAQKSIEAFQTVGTKGAPTDDIVRYQIAVNMLQTDRQQGINQLQQLLSNGDAAVATLAKFALAQVYEADAKYDEAVKLYGELAAAKSDVITPETANLRLAHIYEKQGKKNEAVGLLFEMVKSARERKDNEGKPAEKSTAVREATQQLERLDPKRFSELPKEAEDNA